MTAFQRIDFQATRLDFLRQAVPQFDAHNCAIHSMSMPLVIFWPAVHRAGTFAGRIRAILQQIVSDVTVQAVATCEKAVLAATACKRIAAHATGSSFQLTDMYYT